MCSKQEVAIASILAEILVSTSRYPLLDRRIGIDSLLASIHCWHRFTVGIDSLCHWIKQRQKNHPILLEVSMTRMTGFLGRRSLLKAIGLSSVTYAATVACSQQTDKKVASSQTASTSNAASTKTTAPVARPEAAKMTPDEALALLVQGNERFISGNTVKPRQDPASVRSTGGAQYSLCRVP